MQYANKTLVSYVTAYCAHDFVLKFYLVLLIFAFLFEYRFGSIGGNVILNSLKAYSMIALSNRKKKFGIRSVVPKVSAHTQTNFPLYIIN